MIRLFASDYDGTLVDDASHLHEDTVKAIKRFQSLGGIFMLVTGRDAWQCSDLTGQVKDIPVSASNGSLLFDEKGKRIKEYHLSEKSIRTLDSYVRENGLAVEYRSEKMNYTSNPEPFLYEKAVESFSKRLGKENAINFYHMLFSKNLVFDATLETLLEARLTKMEPLFCKESYIDYILERKDELFPDCLVVKGGFGDNAEITPLSSDKGRSVMDYCIYKGIDPDEVAVIGDGGNDANMLRMFRNSYAPANASDEVKGAASHVCLSNNDLGVARLLNEICDRMQSVL